MVQDTSKLKEDIILIFKRRGPSLPVHVAKETGMSILFASAFLSELIAERRIKISNMRVGNSPIYFVPGQENMLEKFSEYLKSKEKEAFLMLKKSKFLKDSEQDPAIRVALRSIKDFAVPFKENEEIYWKYFNVADGEFRDKKPKSAKQEQKKDIEEKSHFKNKPKASAKKTGKTSKSRKLSNKFLDKVKEFLSEKNAEILEIISANKSELILKIKINGKEKILVAYNKKRIIEKDIINAYNKSKKFNIAFLVMSLGEPSKKLNEFIDAVRVLSDIEKIK